MYLYKYGGVYTDLDVESIAPLDKVLENTELALCLMGDATWEHSTPNSWMASKPGHSFWMFVLDYVMKHINENVQTEHQTGPVMIHRVLKEYQKLQDAEPITLLPQGKSIYYCFWIILKRLFIPIIGTFQLVSVMLNQKNWILKSVRQRW
jgi:mannosyltransferase OCH1-like enzyme